MPFAKVEEDTLIADEFVDITIPPPYTLADLKSIMVQHNGGSIEMGWNDYQLIGSVIRVRLQGAETVDNGHTVIAVFEQQICTPTAQETIDLSVLIALLKPNICYPDLVAAVKLLAEKFKLCSSDLDCVQINNLAVAVAQNADAIAAIQQQLQEDPCAAGICV
jgi:hypothetical protein